MRASTRPDSYHPPAVVAAPRESDVWFGTRPKSRFRAGAYTGLNGINRFSCLVSFTSRRACPWRPERLGHSGHIQKCGKASRSTPRYFADPSPQDPGSRRHRCRNVSHDRSSPTPRRRLLRATSALRMTPSGSTLPHMPLVHFPPVGSVRRESGFDEARTRR